MFDNFLSSAQKQYPPVPMSAFQRSLVNGYNDKVLHQRFDYEEATCLCKEQTFEGLFEFDRYGLWNPVVICMNCGLIQNNPRLTEDEYGRFYSSDDYRSLYEGESYLEESAKRFNKSNHIFEDLNPIISKLGLKTILEVGCGGGWNLLPFDRAGYNVTGVDYSENLTEMGRSYGLNIHQGSIRSLENWEQKYDVIILNHVIEHFTDFFGFMELIIRRLIKNGIIYAGVPNMDHCIVGQLQNAHLYYFTPRTFKRYMSELGLEELAFGTAQNIHMYGVFKLSASRELGPTFKPEIEYARMKKKVFYAKLRYFTALALEKMRIKSLLIKIRDSRR